MTPEELQDKLTKSEAANADLVTSIGKLEKANADLVAERMDLKTKLKENASDETLKAENENLLAKIAGQETRLEELTTDHKSQLNTMKMESMFNDLGISADSPKAKELLIPLLMEGSDFDSDEFRYVGEDKTTMFNGDTKYGLIDKVNDLKENGYGGLFKAATGGGANGNGATPPPQTKTRTQMTLKEKIEYRTTNGEEAYMSLPLA